MVMLKALAWPPRLDAHAGSGALRGGLRRSRALIVPGGVQADTDVQLEVQNAAAGSRVQLVPGECTPGTFDAACNDAVTLVVPASGARVTARLPPGVYYVVAPVGGRRTGQAVIAAVAMPPKPLSFAAGELLSLRSHNFPDRFVRAAADEVVIDAERAAAGQLRTLGQRQMSFRVVAAPEACGAAVFRLESCARPGLMLTHGEAGGSLLRLSVLATACDARASWSPQLPSLASAGRDAPGAPSVTLGFGTTATRSLGAPLGAARDRMVVRHSFGKLVLSPAPGAPEPSAKEAEAERLLAADASWQMVPPLGECGGDQAGKGGVDRNGTDRLVRLGATLLAPTHLAALSVTVGGAPAAALPIHLFGRLALHLPVPRLVP